MRELARRLLLLPREADALPLVRLLQQVREESIPRPAVLGVWTKLLARGGSNGSSSSGTPVSRTPKACNGRPGARAKSAGSAVPVVSSRELEYKRKQAECDLKLLQNRIALLQVCSYLSDRHYPLDSRFLSGMRQSEESKAWKKISQTQERAEVLALRVASLRRHEEKTKHAAARAQQTRSEQRRQHSLKKESVIKKKHAEIQVISKKYQDVEQVKTESRRLKAEREQLQLREVARAKEKREAVRRQEAALKRKKLADQQLADQDVALRLMNKVISEERQIREHQRRVEEMERTERELIARLQGTQLVQQEAYSVLERALLRSAPGTLGNSSSCSSLASAGGRNKRSVGALAPLAPQHLHCQQQQEEEEEEEELEELDEEEHRH